MRRRVSAVATIILMILLAGASAAHSSGQVVVRRLVSPEQAALAARKGLPPPGAVMTPAQADVQRLRVERWRRFPHHLSPPGYDWSPRGVTLRNPHAKEAGLPRAGAAPGDTAAGTPVRVIKVAFIRVDFLNDRTEGASSGTGRFDLSGPDTNVAPIDRPPHNRTFYLKHLEALNRYYDAQSYGSVRVEGDVWPRDENGAYSLGDMADFGPWAFNQEIYRAAVHMFRSMLFAADSQSTARGDRIPWDDYTNVMLIHAGSDLQSDLRGDSRTDIPSFTLGVDDTDRVVFPDSVNVPIERAAIVPETVNQDGFYGTINGVIAHENGHNFFGYADLYDVNTGLPVVGEWSLMDSGNLVGSQVELPDGDVIFAVGLLPPSVDPWQRFFAGDRLTFPEPVWGDTTALLDSERHPDMRRVFLSSDEYLLLENRHITPGDTLVLDQDSTTRVILGPKSPDRYEYDALLPGPGLLVWQIDASVIPFETAFRYNSDFGFNTNPARPGISVIEADALDDLGDPGSPYILGSPWDPYFVGNNTSLSDTTRPNLIPHIGTRPHERLDVLDVPGSVMRFRATRTWQLANWPIDADFPPGGPSLLAIDADGDGDLEVCWAGGSADSPDSAALFAVGADGQGLFGSGQSFATLDVRPRSQMAAIGTGAGGAGPSLFAVTTTRDSAWTSGGLAWLMDDFGQPLPGWPAPLPSPVTTPPVIAGPYPNAFVFVGCENGRVYQIGLDGTVRDSMLVPGGPVTGRLAVAVDGGVFAVAAGTDGGSVAVAHPGVVCAIPASGVAPCGWQRPVGGPGFQPDFLWIDFDGPGPAPRTLVVHHADRLWAFTEPGEALPGWGASIGDTIVPGLGAGDPDGDGFPEVLTQMRHQGVAFWNQDGRPSPGWPKPISRDGFRSLGPPLAVDVDGDGRSEVVALDAAGVLGALDVLGRVPAGWPLATGSGGAGAILAADLDGDGALEVVAPDRAVVDSLELDGKISGRFETLYAYSIGAPPGAAAVTSWPMVGGDPGRTFSLPAARTPVPPAAVVGPYVAGSLKAYPNPARNRKPVSFAFQLSEPAEVTFDIVDASGHRVASFSRAGRQADNLEVWDPGAAPAGLYLARLKFRTGGREHSEVVTVGLIK